MNTILKTYYNIENDVQVKNYFSYDNHYFYLDEFENIDEFLKLYHNYWLYMKQCSLPGYTLLQNYMGEIHTLNHIVFKYNSSDFDLNAYLNVFLAPLPMRVSVDVIKEQWIEKIDYVKECAKEYAYSYKNNIDVLSLIYYYCALGENAVVLLNVILNENPKSTLSMCLSLKRNILPYVYELLNPTYYMYSTRVRHVVQSSFAGRRIVIFSGGEHTSNDSLLTTIKGIHLGGGFGSIIGRNVFQRSKPEALALLDQIIAIFKGEK
jgi:DhnA family fructose-bisphosphate aldolase class Ia